jgi:hypothetical protein
VKTHKEASSRAEGKVHELEEQLSLLRVDVVTAERERTQLSDELAEQTDVNKKLREQLLDEQGYSTLDTLSCYHVLIFDSMFTE